MNDMLPSVAGRSLPTSIAEFERSCPVLLDEEQRKIAPDNAIIGALCNAVRLAREYSDSKPKIDTAGAELRADAIIVANYLAGWWPGLEDGIGWGTSDVDENPAYLAAKRIIKAIVG